MPIAKLAWVCVAAAGIASAQDPALAKSWQVVQKVCGTCHTPESVIANRRTRAQWQETIDKMITTQGAKGTPEEFATVLDYLSTEYSPTSAGRGGAAGGRGAGLGGMMATAGPSDKHVVDEAAADRGRKIWAAECIDCHGTYARGTDNGPNLIRSELVLHDRYADHIGPFLRKGHPMQSGARADSLTAAQISDLAHFIHQRVYDTLRGSPIFVMHNILTGDPAAGKAYFEGAGRCHTCHSPTGDLKGIASRYEPPALEALFLNPRPLTGRGGRGRGGESAAVNPAAKPVTLTVTPPSGPAVTGTPVIFDDFDVAVRDAKGEYHAWKRTPALKVVKNDPYAAHDELLTRYTDKNMHDILAYLVTLK
ncbi:MAG TPA: c-type cytochrome [Bryobacteraceae bacterium]|nr:c-type cytochrome [Bryobacteraceae bacterium]